MAENKGTKKSPDTGKNKKVLFSGQQTMRQAFEQLIERQTCEHFEEWMGQKAS